MKATIPSVISSANVPTILQTGFELHQGFLAVLVNPMVWVKAAGSSGSSGSQMLLDSFFMYFASALALARSSGKLSRLTDSRWFLRITYKKELKGYFCALYTLQNA